MKTFDLDPENPHLVEELLLKLGLEPTQAKRVIDALEGVKALADDLREVGVEFSLGLRIDIPDELRVKAEEDSAFRAEYGPQGRGE